jgi:hypothetical protein
MPRPKRLLNKIGWIDATLPEDEDLCAICHVEYEPSFDNVTILLNCYHKFHTDCLNKYIEYKQRALQDAERRVAELNREPTPSEETLDAVADLVGCPVCSKPFIVSTLTRNNFNSINMWPINPKAPIPELPEAPENLDDILIHTATGGTEFGTTPSIMYHFNQRADDLDEIDHYYSFYKDNLGPRCPLPHMLLDIQIPQPTDSLEFIEMQYEAAVRNNNIARNDYSNATEYYTTFFEFFLERKKGITILPEDRAYNITMKTTTRLILLETERVKTTIKQILDDAKTLLGRFKSGVHRTRNSLSSFVSRRSKTIKKRLIDHARNTYDRARNTLHRLRMRTMPNMYVRIEGGKNKSKKYNKTKKAKKHKNSRKC